LLVSGRGVPLSLVVSAANVNDISGLEPVPESIVVQREQSK
jgi:hypothetical protein